MSKKGVAPLRFAGITVLQFGHLQHQLFCPAMILMALQMQISSKEQHVFFLQLGVGWQEIHRAQSAGGKSEMWDTHIVQFCVRE